MASVLVKQEICGDIKDCTLEKSLINAKPVTSFLGMLVVCRAIKEPILEKSLINAKPVTNVLAKQEI